MALPTTPLSIVCGAIADFFSTSLSAQANNISVLIGAPSEVVSKDESRHRIGLFFYRFSPWGFGPGPASDEPWLIRTHCLITAFGVDEDSVTAGENELRLLGEVLRLLHENPVLAPIDVGADQVQLQVVFQPLGSDDLNHIWSTQGDTSYRPSVAYEMALIPVIPSAQAIPPPLVGSIGAELRADMGARSAPFGGVAQAVPVAAEAVDPRVEGWAPRICFVHEGACLQAIALAVGSPELSAFEPPAVWVAGDVGATVTLRWDTWEAAGGWSEDVASQDVSPVTTAIDPDDPPPAAALATMALPFTDRKGQALLYATRTYVRGSDSRSVQVRGNPLLVTLY